MKFYVWEEEWYPVIVAGGEELYCKVIEASEEDIARWKATFQAFEDLQNELRTRMKQS